MATISVTNSAELQTAFNSTAVAGDVIECLSGVNFGAIVFTSGRTFTTPVTITSSNTASPATFKRFTFNNCTNVTVSYMTADGDYSVTTGVSTTADDACLITFHNCVNVTVDRCRLNGNGVSTGNWIYCGIGARDTTNLVMNSNEITGTRYGMLMAQCTGGSRYGNYIHDWHDGDAMQWANSGDFTSTENFTCRYIRGSSAVHADGFQVSQNATGYLHIYKDVFMSPFNDSTDGSGENIQPLLLQTGAGQNLIVEDCVIFNQTNNSLRCVGWNDVTLNRNTIIECDYASATLTANKPVTSILTCTGALSCTNSISPVYSLQAGTTSTNNLTLRSSAYGASNFPNVVQDGTGDFDNLRAASGSSIVSNAQGSVYTRTAGLYPAGYQLYQEYYLSAGDTTPPAYVSNTPTVLGGTAGAISATIAVTFSESIALGTGNIVLRADSGSGFTDLETFDVATNVGTGSGLVSVSGPTLTIQPSSALADGVNYAIRIASTCIDDFSANSFAGVTDDTTIAFTVSIPASNPLVMTGVTIRITVA